MNLKLCFNCRLHILGGGNGLWSDECNQSFPMIFQTEKDQVKGIKMEHV